MPSPIPEYIKGYEKVIAIFGFWPSFHDAPARLNREAEDRLSLELKPFESFCQGNKAEARRHPYNRHRITFSFTNIVTSNVQAFGADNIIFELGFSSLEYFRENGSFVVDMESAMGCDMGGHLRARSGEVLIVEEVSHLL